MRRPCNPLVLILALAATTGGARAADSEARMGRLLEHAAYRPSTTALSIADRDFLGYGASELPRAQLHDINGDGIPERFVVAHDSLCGTGGCPVLLLEGRSGHRIGEFFGAVAVLRRRVNGYAVIQLVSRRDIATTGIETQAFKRGSYARVSHALLDENGMREWRAGLDAGAAR